MLVERDQEFAVGARLTKSDRSKSDPGHLDQLGCEDLI